MPKSLYCTLLFVVSLCASTFGSQAYGGQASVLLSMDRGGINLGGDYQFSNAAESGAVFMRLYPKDEDELKPGVLVLGGGLRYVGGSRFMVFSATIGGSLMSVDTIADEELLIGPSMAIALRKRLGALSIGLEHLSAYSWFGDDALAGEVLRDTMLTLTFQI